MNDTRSRIPDVAVEILGENVDAGMADVARGPGMDTTNLVHYKAPEPTIRQTLWART